MEMIIGGRYKWKYQPERLIYIGKKGSWHQFEKVAEPGVVWCEVLDEDLHMLEETKEPEVNSAAKDTEISQAEYERQEAWTERFAREPRGREIAELIRDICEMEEPPEDDERAVRVNLDWLREKLAALSTEAQPEVTGALGYVATKAGRFEFVGYDNKFLRDAYEDNGWTITAAYPPSAIEAAVREKLEEAARICEMRSKGINCQQSLRDCAKRIRALMESPQPSVEEPAN